MISEVIKIIQNDEWCGVSKRMEIAKGKNKIVTSWGGVFKYIKRIAKWPKK